MVDIVTRYYKRASYHEKMIERTSGKDKKFHKKLFDLYLSRAEKEKKRS